MAGPPAALVSWVDPELATAYSEALGDLASMPPRSVSPLFVPALHGRALLVPMLHDCGAGMAPAINLGHDFELVSPFVPGEAITCELGLVDFRPQGRNSLLVAGVRYCSGDTVRLVSRDVVFVLTPMRRPDLEPMEPAPPAVDRKRVFTPLVEHEVPPDICARWANATLDFQAIHLDDAVARACGFRTTIAHGTYSMATIARLLVEDLLDGDPGSVRRLAARLAKPIHPGERMVLSVTEPVPLATGRTGRGFRCVVNGRVVIRDGWIEHDGEPL